MKRLFPVKCYSKTRLFLQNLPNGCLLAVKPTDVAHSNASPGLSETWKPKCVTFFTKSQRVAFLTPLQGWLVLAPPTNTCNVCFTCVQPSFFSSSAGPTSARSNTNLESCLALTMWGFFSCYSLGTAKSNENINLTHAKEEAWTVTGHSKEKKKKKNNTKELALQTYFGVKRFCILLITTEPSSHKFRRYSIYCLWNAFLCWLTTIQNQTWLVLWITLFSITVSLVYETSLLGTGISRGEDCSSSCIKHPHTSAFYQCP